MLNEISQTRKNKYCLIPLIGGPRGVKTIETENSWWGPGAGGGDGECFMGTEFQFVKMRKFWRWMVGMAA